MTTAIMEEERLLRRKEVERLTGLSTTGLYNRLRDGSFPKQLHVGPGCVRWRLSDVKNWMNSLETR